MYSHIYSPYPKKIFPINPFMLPFNHVWCYKFLYWCLNKWMHGVKRMLRRNSDRLDLEDEDINIIYNQRAKGNSFLDFTAVDFKRWEIPGGPAKKIKKLINKVYFLHVLLYLPIILNTMPFFLASYYHQTCSKTHLHYCRTTW